MPSKKPKLGDYALDVHRDSTDFRDLIYRPALVPLQREMLPRADLVNVRNQGREGACTGFGLAAAIDYLNGWRHENGITDSAARVSSRMLYEMAKLHDQWPGQEYEGSSARGAMKGWYKHGVCYETDWPYKEHSAGALTMQRQDRALANPLGAYYRVLPRRTDMQAALSEAQTIFVTAKVHDGWREPVDGVIQYEQGAEATGGHAFAVLGYTDAGLIIQNSWGEVWGGIEIDGVRCGGLAVWTYADFDDNLMDAWVARMARPVESIQALRHGGDIAETASGPQRIEAGPPSAQIIGHYVHVDDGQFDPEGDYPSFAHQALDNVQAATQAKHIVLWAHGGLNSVKGAAKRVAALTPVFAANDIYNLHFIWETGVLGELRDVLLGKQHFAEDRAGGWLSSWWDRLLEKGTWPLGRPLWAEMISDAEVAFQARLKLDKKEVRPAGSRVLDYLKTELLKPGVRSKVHLVGHSAGSILLAHALRRWHALSGPAIQNLILMAPAATQDLFTSAVLPRFQGHDIERLTLYILSDEKEKDDTVAGIYRKSLLYLVSNSYQKSRFKLNGESVPLLGMAKFIEPVRKALGPHQGRGRIYVSGVDTETASESHGGFDNDVPTMNSLLRTILGATPTREFSPEDLDY
jgi:hypothetical protein